MKKCTRCNELKEAINFGKDSHKKDFLRPNCKQCDAIYWAQKDKEFGKKVFIKHAGEHIDESKWAERRVN